MRAPTPNCEPPSAVPETYDVPRLGFDFGDAADLDPGLESELEQLWTVLCRAWESRRIVLSPPEVVEMIDVYLDRARWLDAADCHDLERFMNELGALRSPDRDFEALTAIEFDIVMILQRTARRELSEDELVSAVLLNDESDRDRDHIPGLDLSDAFERRYLSVDAKKADQETETEGDR